ncbi:hypothetical protein KR084_009171 [Drosophila pseudotakahashii]|nr:hypothetical protein KR084_009171 [Drosophila pseudotakahashii]
MRLFLIGLLALGSARAFSVIRTSQPHAQLVAYSPARGEFPVVSGLAQGYVRYYDGTGAERLLPYNYPEPLNGIRDLATSSLIRSGLEQQQQESQQIALFRAWCEQRYQAMRLELDRLKEQGLKPTPQLLAQFEPLEQIVKFAAFEAVPGLTPEVQRARDEQLRIWNEARLEVLRAEQAQQLLGQSMEYQYQLKKEEKLPLEQQVLVKTSTPQVVSRIETPQTHSYGQFAQSQDSLLLKTGTQTAPQPVEETPEVKLARQEHLKQFNEALLRQPGQETAILKTVPGIQQPIVKSTTTTTFETQPSLIQGIFQTNSYPEQQTPLAIEETPEVKRAREEHLKLFNEALLRQPAAPEEPILNTTPIQQAIITFPDQQPIQETPEVKRAREEHLKQYNEAILRQPIEVQQQPLLSTPQAIFKSPIAEPLSPLPIQDTPEVKLAREQHLLLLSQAKIKAEDKVADIADMIRLEERERDRERLMELEMRKQEEKEAEVERQLEADRLREETRLLEAERLKIEQEDRLRLESEKQEQLQLKATAINTFQKDTPEYLRKAEQFKIINNQLQPQQQQPNIVTQQQQVQNGFFLRIQTNQPNVIQPVEQPANPFLVRYTTKPAEIQLPLQTLVPLPQPLPQLLTPTIPNSQLKAGYSSSTSSSELDKATREHFRAHEIALEQLRLANLKNPWTPDCQH